MDDTILMVGGLMTEWRFIGPFPTWEQAIEYGLREFPDVRWHAARLEQPAAVPPEVFHG